MIDSTIPVAPALPANAPVTFELYDWTQPTPVLASIITIDTQETDFIPDDAVYARERGAAAWHRSSKPLVFGDFEFGVHLLVSHAGNTTSGTQPLQEALIAIKRAGDWQGFPFSEHYDKKNHSVFPKAFKIVSKDAAGKIVHTYEMHDGLPMNDPSLYQGSPTWAGGKENRPFVCAGMSLPWWNEQPRRSASLEAMYAGITEDGMRPSAAKSHFSVLGCEPEITGGYSGWSLNSLGNIWVNKEWPMPKGSYWPEAGATDPYFNYSDCCMEGRSAFMGPWIEGYMYEPGSRTTHNWYCAPGGPRFDRAAFPSQIALFMTDPNGKRPDGVSYSVMAYQFALAYNNHPNKLVTDVTKLFLRPDEDLLESRLYWTGNYYGDGGPDGPNAIRMNANQREGANDSHFDKDGFMPFHGWGRDSLHDYANAANGAIAFQSPMMMVLSKFDTISAFMSHGSANWSGAGSDYDSGSYMVRDMAWNWLHHVLAWKVATSHPLGFSRKDIEDRFCKLLESIHRDILTPIKGGVLPQGRKMWLEGIKRFGQPVSESNGRWEFHGGGLGFYLGGVLIYLKQSGMYAAIQARGGKAYEALMFTIRNACQYAFGMFAETRATMFSNPQWPQDWTFEDGTHMPSGWKELSLRNEDQTVDMNGNDKGDVWGDRDVSIHPTIQFIYAMRDYYPEIDHPNKAKAIANVDMYLKRQTDKVKAFEGNPGAQRDSDHIYRYPGVAPLKAPAIVGPGLKVELPVFESIPLDLPPPPKVYVGAPTGEGTWVYICGEGENATVDAGVILRYGIDDKRVFMAATGLEFNASNEYFGNDPAPGIRKFVDKFVPTVAAPEPVIVPEPVVVPPVVQEPVVEAPVQPEAPVTPVAEAPQAAPQNPVEPEPVIVPAVDYGKAMEAAAVTFLVALGYTVTK